MYCCISGCCNTSKNNTKGIKFYYFPTNSTHMPWLRDKRIKWINAVVKHTFPVDLKRKRKWVEAVRREEKWIPTKHHRICSLHFESECYNVNSKQKTLYKDAVPTLHLPKFAFETKLDTNTQPENLEKSQVNETKSKIPKPGTSRNLDRLSKLRLKRQINEKNKKIKRLQYKNRCLTKKIASLEEILDTLNKKSLINDEDQTLLERVSRQ